MHTFVFSQHLWKGVQTINYTTPRLLPSGPIDNSQSSLCPFSQSNVIRSIYNHSIPPIYSRAINNIIKFLTSLAIGLTKPSAHLAHVTHECAVQMSPSPSLLVTPSSHVGLTHPVKPALVWFAWAPSWIRVCDGCPKLSTPTTYPVKQLTDA